MSLCEKRIVADGQDRFGKRLLLLETFVDPSRFQGTVYRAANGTCRGRTQGFRRTRTGYTAHSESPKLVFVRPLQRGMRGYKAIAAWAKDLKPRARERFGCRREQGI